MFNDLYTNELFNKFWNLKVMKSLKRKYEMAKVIQKYVAYMTWHDHSVSFARHWSFHTFLIWDSAPQEPLILTITLFSWSMWIVIILTTRFWMNSYQEYFFLNFFSISSKSVKAEDFHINNSKQNPFDNIWSII